MKAMKIENVENLNNVRFLNKEAIILYYAEEVEKHKSTARFWFVAAMLLLNVIVWGWL